VPFIPDDRVGFYPGRLEIGVIDDLGNQTVQVDFGMHFDNGARKVYQFISVFGDEGPGIVTSNDFQNLAASAVSDQGSTALLQMTDANLVTITDPPPTIPSSSQTVRLSLGGFVFGVWQVQFDDPVDTFNLDGRWRELPPFP
jgi:hypothetical protein